MSTKYIFTFCFYSIFLPVCISLFHYNDRTWKMVWVMIVIGILFCPLFIWWEKKRDRLNMNQFLDLEESDIDGKVLQKDWINHVRFWKIIAVPGFGFLFEDRLLFVQQKRRRAEMSIPFSEITEMLDVKLWGILNTGLKITLKSGKTELFVLDKKGNFYKALMKLK